MCKVMEDMRNEAAREAALKAAREADRASMIKTARRMWKSDQFTYTYEDIADILEITVDEVKALIEGKPPKYQPIPST